MWCARDMAGRERGTSTDWGNLIGGNGGMGKCCLHLHAGGFLGCQSNGLLASALGERGLGCPILGAACIATWGVGIALPI